MVSKLLLAAQECYQQAVDEEADTDLINALAQAYYDIRQGLGFNKTPAEYGAFPTDPYSHTPLGGKARQPGMTGQVKEEILTRMGELGVSVRRGTLCFAPTLLQKKEFLHDSTDFTYFDSSGEQKFVSLPQDSLAFSVCQTPVIYVLGDRPKIEVRLLNSDAVVLDGNCLDLPTTQHILNRDGRVEQLRVTVEL